jgi:alpha-1,6-mannosyltransferase
MISPSNTTVSWRFWLVGLILVVYVAACTGQRDNKWGADAWEHHRVVVALSRQLWKPGNPTYASDLPSVRYSPYMIGWAAVSRFTGIDPYNALSAAAVVNTALLVIGVAMLLSAYGEGASATTVLIVMIALWGGAPAYANSYALSDLPWHQVNPSAFSFALTLIGWSILRRISMERLSAGWAVIVLLLAAIAMLDHPMTGSFGIMGLMIVAVTGPAATRIKMMAIVLAIAVGVAAACLAWPWYSFLAALRNKQDNDYWFNRAILNLTLTQWCAPALLCVLFAIPFRQRPLVRVCLVGCAASLAVGLSSLIVHSPVLARFPLPGMIFAHMAIGVFAHESGILSLSTWPGRLRALLQPVGQAAYPILQCVVAVLLAYCLVPQLIDVATAPHLGRTYLTKLTHSRNLQEHVRQEFSDLLSPIGMKDVVIADPNTEWLVPSFKGRVVSAMHYELFVPHQGERAEAVDTFFAPGTTEAQRDAILHDYGVQWIVLNRRWIGDGTFNRLLRKPAVVREDGGMVLMNAAEWMKAAS